MAHIHAMTASLLGAPGTEGVIFRVIDLIALKTVHVPIEVHLLQPLIAHGTLHLATILQMLGHSLLGDSLPASLARDL
jgi:hypothetical protein